MRKSRFFVTGIVLLVSIICLSACSRHERKGYYDPDNIEIKTEKELSEIRSKLQQNPKDLALNCAVWKYFTMWDMLDSLVVDASSVYNRAKSDGDSILMAYAGAYLGQAYFYTSRLDSMIFYFDRILGIAEKNRLYFPLIATYNNLSMYRIYAYLDYAGALDYLHQALSVIEASGNKTNYCATLCNMASVYFERKDLEGMKYAEKAYQLANADNNEYFILMSSLFLSRFHVLSGDSSEGLKYVRQVLKIVESGEEYKYYQVLAYSIYAELLSADGDYIAAEKYFRQAIGIWNENNSGFMEVMLSYCGYADLLLKQGRYTEAKHIIQYSSGLAIRKQSREALPEIYRILSDAHAGLRHPDSSLIYYKKYTAIRDSIYTVEKEREFNNLAMKYEKAKHDEEITKKELELSRQKRTNIIVYFMSAIFLLVACGIYYINARKNMMYRKLVEKDMERLKIKPKGSIRNVHEKDGHQEFDISRMGPINEEAGKELFMKVEKLIAEEKLYRDPEITLEVLVEKVGSNRWYVSRVINEFTHKSFPNYINEFRINEAVKILSDPENETPLKQIALDLGYRSISVFYKYFQQKTGVPPSKYRNEARRLLNS